MTQKIEQAVNKVGSALGELLKAFEKHGAELNDEQVNKVFQFIGNTFANVHRQALVARQVNMAERFTLDMDLPNTAHPTAALPTTTTIVAPGITPPTRFVMPEGKLVGSKQPVYPAQTLDLESRPKAPALTPPDENDIEFLDE